MFTGIVEAQGRIRGIEAKPGLLHVALEVPGAFMKGLKNGASVAVNGVCLTVTGITGSTLTFDVMEETLKCTTLGAMRIDDSVNIERSLKRGDELGGHLVSGHVHAVATIALITKTENNVVMTFAPPEELRKYIFPKGFIALDGVSLTVVDVSKNTFTVSLIPETLARTTLGSKSIGDLVNLEVDQQTRTIVDTVRTVLPSLLSS